MDFGIPLQLILDGIGGPANALSALNSTAVTLGGALQTGNVAVAAATILDAPAVVTNAFLNGTTTISLPPATLFGQFSSGTYLNLGGILTPLTEPAVTLNGFPLPTGGPTPIGGLIPGLLSFGPQLAADITPIT